MNVAGRRGMVARRGVIMSCLVMVGMIVSCSTGGCAGVIVIVVSVAGMIMIAVVVIRRSVRGRQRLVRVLRRRVGVIMVMVMIMYGSRRCRTRRT